MLSLEPLSLPGGYESRLSCDDAGLVPHCPRIISSPDLADAKMEGHGKPVLGVTLRVI